MPVLGLGVQLCRRGTDLLCYFGLIQVSVQNLGLIVWLSSCCCNCRLFRGGWAGCVQHLAATLIKGTVLLWDQMMTNKFTFIQFSLAGFVPSSLILPAKGSVYFPWNGRGPATQSSFKNKPLKRKTKEKEQKSDIVRLYRADPDAEFQAAGARGLFKCNTNSTIFGWFETLPLPPVLSENNQKRELPILSKRRAAEIQYPAWQKQMKGQKHFHLCALASWEWPWSCGVFVPARLKHLAGISRCIFSGLQSYFWSK